MNQPISAFRAHRARGFALLRGAALCAAFAGAVLPVQSATPLADEPLFSAANVPGNLLLALSVEYPTAISVANLGDYSATFEYLGYFDPKKCYTYKVEAKAEESYFQPASLANAKHECAGQWSGNFLNWATMQTIDPYRWALTGGYRATDTETSTILEKAWGSSQGGNSNFPNRGTNQGSGHKLGVAAKTVTPFAWDKFNLRIWARGARMVFTGSGDVNAGAPVNWLGAGADEKLVHQLYVRVEVCNKSVSLESNCVAYGPDAKGNYNYKPEGLMQKYADKIRYSAFGYLNDSNIKRDGGVMRARMKFIGPTKPVPGSLPVSNSLAEWSASTGVFLANPDKTDADNSKVGNSGAMNYLNKFGRASGLYKTYDNIGEMYYAAIRYFKNQGNVDEYTSGLTDTMIDGFPVITKWDDPILYSCQKNFILGIGDTNTHADGNLPGSALTGSNPAMPSAVSGDKTVDVTKATNKVGQLEKLGDLGTKYAPGGTNNTYFMAGLAYDSHTKDIRADLDKSQTIATFWLDVLEYQKYVSKNFYWLAAKYGGFAVPDGFDPYTHTAELDDGIWYSGEKVSGSSDKRPENYFTADRADKMVAALKSAFDKIAKSLKANTTSFSTALPQIASTGSASYAGSFDAATWSGELEASTLTYDSKGVPSLAKAWTFSTKLAAQLAGTGWDSQRRVISWNGGKGVPFREKELTDHAADLATPYAAHRSVADFVNYLRGDRSYDGTKSDGKTDFRARPSLLGDIVGSKVRPVGPPALPLSNASNPGYADFKANYASRPTMVYFGANDGMLHAVMGDTNGKLDGEHSGREIFAYVPKAVFAGPSGTPSVDGLAALGDPTFAHHYYVNASPTAYDIDFGKTDGGGSTDWRTVLIGGLGKGGRGYYAIDVTSPAVMLKADEATLAKNVLWETHGDDKLAAKFANMGYGYGDPVVVKTRRYGWVVVLTSGYNNSDGKGYFFIVNPRTGELLQEVPTNSGSSADPAGLAHAVGFTNDRSVGLADAVYAGDLQGKVWRLDLTSKTDNYTVQHIATLTDGTEVQPVTTKPTVAAAVGTLDRFVMLGTGRMLADSDIGNKQVQSFYAIVDGKEAAFGGALPSGIKYPVGRSSMIENTDPKKGVKVNTAKEVGWFHDLGGSWRVITDPLSGAGYVTFASTLPNGNACSPAGSSRLYSINFASGASNLEGGAYVGIEGSITDVRMVMVTDADGKTTQHVVAGQDNSPNLTDPPLKDNDTKRTLRRMNWRELPLAD